MKAEFQLLMNNPNSNEYMVAIKNLPQEERKSMIQQIKKNQTMLSMSSYLLTLQTKDKPYTFDMNPYQKLIERYQSTEISIGLVFMDEDNQINRDFYRFFTVKLV